MMRIDKNDPRLIDFALGELAPEEAKTIEAVLALPENAEARAEVLVFQGLTKEVAGALAGQAGWLDADQRDAVLDAAEKRRFQLRFRWGYLVGCAAAVLVAAAFVLPYFARAREAYMRPESEMAWLQERLDALPEGYERFLVPDINNPAQVNRESFDLSDEQVRRDLRERLPELEQMADQQQRQLSELRSMPEASETGVYSVSPAPLPELKQETSSQAWEWKDMPTGTASNLPVLQGGYGGSGVARGARSAPAAPRQRGRGNEREAAPEVYKYDINGDGDDENIPFYTRPDGTVVSNEAYAPIVENPFTLVTQAPLSTFGVDVDTASYTNVRRFLEQGQRPPADAVRIEELVNYFDYHYAPPAAGSPFAVVVDVAACPWAPQHQLARVALQGQVVSKEKRPAVNLVFLLDVSGSMEAASKLPLVQASMQALLRELDSRDRVGIVTYAGQSRVVLESTSASEPAVIRSAIDGLRSGGSTNGGAGIEQAYAMAERHFIKGAANRVVLATDGDFNVGVTSHGDLMQMIEAKRDKGVFLTVLGYGMGNIKDATLEQLADKGNGNYAYIDDYRAAQRVLVDQLTGTLVTIAKDVKIQVEFNPANVSAYRLIGYENRALAAQDFNDDRKDAGEIGAGHQVTALYEIVPAGVAVTPGVDGLRYQTPPAPVEEARPGERHTDELMTVKLRYKHPDGDTSRRIDLPISAEAVTSAPDDDFRFASAVAAWGMLLRNSHYSGTSTIDMVRELATDAAGSDAERQAFLGLVSMSRNLLQ